MKKKESKVIGARFVHGVQLATEVVTSVSVGSKFCDQLELGDHGLLVVVTRYGKEYRYIVPHANLRSVELDNGG